MRTFNSFRILKKTIESHLYFALEYVFKLVWHIQGFLVTHEIWLQQTYSRESIFQFFIYNKRSYNLFNILKSPDESHFNFASEYIVNINHIGLTCPGIWHHMGSKNGTVWRHPVFSNFQILTYNNRTFNLINILKNQNESYFNFASEYIIMLVWHCPGFCRNTGNMAAAYI